MSESQRYQYTFNRETAEPIGVVDSWYTPEPPAREVVRQSHSMPPAYTVVLWLLVFAFAAGGCLLFGRRAEQAPTVVVCPAPGVQVAVLPAECGKPTWAVKP
ncbi:MAG: hypothetical protein JWN03_6679 [Nocardia sp.]|uniref:hypothetical protein n=1 Tax=Nocardia sp. TaxID=1821 RepID=UPI00260C5E93|nr:hypothetical protein [Nocardia sp.]MCU1646404.1 hypothetical protein [Nocardia sp.]